VNSYLELIPGVRDYASAYRTSIVSGVAAGAALAIPGIKLGDKILSVTTVESAATPSSQRILPWNKNVGTIQGLCPGLLATDVLVSCVVNPIQASFGVFMAGRVGGDWDFSTTIPALTLTDNDIIHDCVIYDSAADPLPLALTEFSISSDDVINNAAGTDTSGKIVRFEFTEFVEQLDVTSAVVTVVAGIINFSGTGVGQHLLGRTNKLSASADTPGSGYIIVDRAQGAGGLFADYTSEFTDALVTDGFIANAAIGSSTAGQTLRVVWADLT